MEGVSRESGGNALPHGIGFGAELRRRRVAAGLSQAALARLVAYDRTLISKIENSAESPSEGFAAAVDRALEADGALAALTSTAKPRDLAALVPADEETVAWLRDALSALRRIEHLTSPEPLITALAAHVQTIRTVRQAARESIRRALIGLAAEYADTLSGLCQEAADVTAAVGWRDRSVEWALQAGTDYRDFVAYTNTCRSSLAWWRGDAAGAFDAAHAVRYVEGHVPMALQAGVAHYEARALALLGDEAACMARLEESARLSERAVREETPSFLWSGVDVEILAAVCLTDLGHGARAAEIMARGLEESWRLSTGRSQHVSLSRLAKAYLVAGEYEQAAAAGAAALVPAARSGARRTIADLWGLRAQLVAVAGTVPAVKDFDDRLRAPAKAN